MILEGIYKHSERILRELAGGFWGNLKAFWSLQDSARILRGFWGNLKGSLESSQKSIIMPASCPEFKNTPYI